MRPLILVGGGGRYKSVIEAAGSKELVIEGILGLPENVGEQISNYPVIGTDNGIPHLVSDFDLIVTLGSIEAPFLRTHLYERIRAAGGRLATVTASTAHVSQHTIVQYGMVILHHACVNAGALIGKGCIISAFANIEHGTLIDDCCHISTDAMVDGDCRTDKHTFPDDQSVMVNGTEIAADCVIAAGTVVRKNILYKGIYSGNPALLKVRF